MGATTNRCAAPPRPRDDDDVVYQALAARLAYDIAAVIGAALTDAMLADLLEEIRDHLGDETMPERLQRRWDLAPGLQLAAVLDHAPAVHAAVYRDLICKWVADNDIRLSLPVGTRVTSPRGPGTIVRWECSSARYVIAVDALKRSMGHHHVGALYAPEQVTAGAPSKLTPDSSLKHGFATPREAAR